MTLQELYAKFESSYEEIKEIIQKAIDEITDEEERDDYNESLTDIAIDLEYELNHFKDLAEEFLSKEAAVSTAEKVKEACDKFLHTQKDSEDYNTSLAEFKKFFHGYTSSINVKEIYLAHYSPREGFAITNQGILYVNKDKINRSFWLNEPEKPCYCIPFYQFGRTSKLYLDVESYCVYADNIKLTDSNTEGGAELVKLFKRIKEIVHQ